MSIPQVVKDLLNSEKGVLAITLLIAITVLTALGKMTLAEWQNMALWVFGIYTGGKAVQGAAAQFSGRTKEIAPTTQAPASTSAAGDKA
jgi:hypothetical protein